MALSRKRKIIIIVSAVALLGIIVVISILAGGKDEPEVTTVVVKRRPELRSTVTASGEVRPIQYINMTSEVAGRIEEIYVKEGDRVTKGQQLVRLDPKTGAPVGQPLPVPRTASGIAIAFGSIWVMTGDGVVRVQPSE